VSATTNSLLTLFPDAYLHGALLHAADWEKDDAALQKYSGLSRPTWGGSSVHDGLQVPQVFK